MEWTRFHFICRQVFPLLDTGNNNKSVEDIITEVEQSPLTKLYGKAKPSKKNITNKILNHLKTLPNNSESKGIFKIYGAIDLSDNNKSQKYIRSIIIYPIFVSIMYMYFATVFSKLLFPDWKEFVDIDSLDKIQYIAVQGNNIVISIALILLMTSFFFTYSLYAIRLLKINVKPDASILKIFFKKDVQESYLNLHTLIHFPMEMNMKENDSSNNGVSNLPLKQHLRELIQKDEGYSREYKDLCLQQEALLSSTLKSHINIIKVILFISITAAISGLVIGAYGVIILFGGSVL